MSENRLNMDETLAFDPSATTEGLATEAGLPGGLKADEILGTGEGTEFAPVLEGNEASRSTQDFASLASYQVPEGRYALLDEVAANIDGNGEVRIAVPGAGTVAYTGSLDVALEFGGAILLPGHTVLVVHQSTDGNSATNRASITGREV